MRETWAHVPLREADGGQGDKMCPIYRADGDAAFEVLPDEWNFTGPWRPSIFMPRQASRLTLRITDARVERLQDISEVDAAAEGIENVPDEFGCNWISRHAPETRYNRAALAYEALWASINGNHSPSSWSANPWVWALTFTVEQRNVDDVTQKAA